MSVVAKEDVVPSLIANTVMEKVFADGVHKRYYITAADGYLLHDNRADGEVLDPETLEPTGEVLLRYTAGTKSVNADYDFTAVVADAITDINGNTIAVYKIGAFELFAVPASAIPENQTYGCNNTQVMTAKERAV